MFCRLKKMTPYILCAGFLVVLLCYFISIVFLGAWMPLGISSLRIPLT